MDHYSKPFALTFGKDDVGTTWAWGWGVGGTGAGVGLELREIRLWSSDPLTGFNLPPSLQPGKLTTAGTQTLKKSVFQAKTGKAGAIGKKTQEGHH